MPRSSNSFQTRLDVTLSSYPRYTVVKSWSSSRDHRPSVIARSCVGEVVVYQCRSLNCERSMGTMPIRPSACHIWKYPSPKAFA